MLAHFKYIKVGKVRSKDRCNFLFGDYYYYYYYYFVIFPNKINVTCRKWSSLTKPIVINIWSNG
ncbi:MAG: hypothetical protein N7Q72_06435, partial [Spiroplasma sp. Tabriz.8]|nr:hypothetical protein [Spiroplasma sp. Tabriz.8]